MLSERTIGYLLVALSGVGFGVLSILVKTAYSLGGDPFTILGVRFVLATILIWIIALRLDRPALRMDPRDIVYIALVGPLGVGIGSMLYFSALTFVDASLYVALFYTYPAVVNVASAIVFREPLTLRQGLALVITFAGVVLVTGLLGQGQVNASVPGILLGLATGAAYAVYTLGMQRQLRRHPPLAINAYLLTFGTLSVLIVRPPTQWSGALTLPVLAVIATMAVVCTIGPIVLYLTGIRRIGAGAASIVSNMEPITTIVLAVLLLGEVLDPLQMTGIVAVLGGVLILETG